MCGEDFISLSFSSINLTTENNQFSKQLSTTGVNSFLEKNFRASRKSFSDLCLGFPSAGKKVRLDAICEVSQGVKFKDKKPVRGRRVDINSCLSYHMILDNKKKQLSLNEIVRKKEECLPAGEIQVADLSERYFPKDFLKEDNLEGTMVSYMQLPESGFESFFNIVDWFFRLFFLTSPVEILSDSFFPQIVTLNEKNPGPRLPLDIVKAIEKEAFRISFERYLHYIRQGIRIPFIYFSEARKWDIMAKMISDNFTSDYCMPADQIIHFAY